MRILLKEKGVVGSCFMLFSVPLTFLRDYTCPTAELTGYSRNRAAAIPITLVFSFMWLGEMMNGDDYAQKYEIAGICACVGLPFSILIFKKT